MPLVDPQTIGSRVADARGRAHLTQSELANALGLDRSALAKIESGSRRVSALELAGIAEHTGEPFEWFVLDPPAAVVSYRAASATSTWSSIDRVVEHLARDVELLQSLGTLHVAEFQPLPRPEDSPQAEQLAVEVRERLNVAASDPITDLVTPIADLGLFAFATGLGTDAPDAATTLLARGGVSVVNADRGVGRRRLALAHELGHYLVADAYTVDWRVGVPADAQRVERLFDVFARALLLPATALREHWVATEELESVREVAVRVASKFRVDMSTLAARLEELDLAETEQLSVVRRTTTTRSDIIEFDLMVPHDLEGASLPRAYEKAVLRLYRSERISAARAIDLLHGSVDETDLPPLSPAREDEIWKLTS